MKTITITWRDVKGYVNDNVPTSEMSVAQRAFHDMCYDANQSAYDPLTIFITEGGEEYFKVYEEDTEKEGLFYPYDAFLSDYGVKIADGMLVPISNFLEELCENTHAF